MTAMLALTTRLRMARTLAWIGPSADHEKLAGLIGELRRAQADLIILDPARQAAGQLAAAYRRAGDARVILGIARDAQLLQAVRADAFAGPLGAGPTRAHQWGLYLAEVADPGELATALADDAVDAVVIGPELVPAALTAANPTDPRAKPWFCRAADAGQGARLIGQGVRRVACCPASAESIRRVRESLAGPWRAEMARVDFAALGGDLGRPVATRPGLTGAPVRSVTPPGRGQSAPDNGSPPIGG